MKKRIAILLSVLVILTFSLSFVGCGNESKSNVTVSMSQATKNIEVYEQFKLTADVKNSDAAIVWTSDNDSVVSVKDGIISGIAEGSAVISATVSGVAATCAVTVSAATQAPIITPSYSELSVKKDNTANVNVKITYKGIAVGASEFKWTASSSIITVTPSPTDSSIAVISGVEYGDAQVTVKGSYLGKEYSSTIAITVIENVVFEITNILPQEGAYQKTIYLSTPADADEVGDTGFIDEFTTSILAQKDGKDVSSQVTWLSENEAVATVVNGKIEPLSAGNVNVKATYTSEKETYNILVNVTVKRPTINLTKTQDKVYLQKFINLKLAAPSKVTENKDVVEVLAGDIDLLDTFNKENGEIVLKADKISALTYGDNTIVINTSNASYKLNIVYCTLAIANAAQLNKLSAAIKSDNSAYIILTDNIDYRTTLTGGAHVNTHFKTFMSDKEEFNGVFDGGGHYIRGMTIKGYAMGFIRNIGEKGIVKNTAFIEAVMGGNGSWHTVIDVDKSMDSAAAQKQNTGVDSGSYITQINKGLISNLFISGKLLSDGVPWAGTGNNTMLASGGKGKIENVMIEVTETPAILTPNGSSGNCRVYSGSFYAPGGNWWYAMKLNDVYSVGCKALLGVTNAAPFTTNVNFYDSAYRSHGDFAGKVSGWDSNLWSFEYNIPVFKTYGELIKSLTITIAEPATSTIYTGEACQFKLTDSSGGIPVVYTMNKADGVTLSNSGLLTVGSNAKSGVIEVSAYAVFDDKFVSANKITINIVESVNINIAKMALNPTFEYGRNEKVNQIDFSSILTNNPNLVAALKGSLIKIVDKTTFTAVDIVANNAIANNKITIANETLKALGHSGAEEKTWFLIIKDSSEICYRIEIVVNNYTLKIMTVADLNLMSTVMIDNLNGYYTLGADIDYRTAIAGGAYENTHFKTFITGEKQEFNGIFDGCGHFIRGMTIKGYSCGFISAIGAKGIVKNVAFTEAQMGGNGSWSVLVDGKVMTGDEGQHKDTGADKGGFIAYRNNGLISNVFVSGKIVSNGVPWVDGGGNTLLASNGIGAVRQCMVETTGVPTLAKDEKIRWGSFTATNYLKIKNSEVFGLGGRVMVNNTPGGTWTELEWKYYDVYNCQLSQSAETLNKHKDFEIYRTSVAKWNKSIWNTETKIPVFMSYYNSLTDEQKLNLAKPV